MDGATAASSQRPVGFHAPPGAPLLPAMRPFPTGDEAIAAVLDLIHRVLGLRTPFVARTSHQQCEVVAVDARNGCRVQVGDTLPLEDSY